MTKLAPTTSEPAVARDGQSLRWPCCWPAARRPGATGGRADARSCTHRRRWHAAAADTAETDPAVDLDVLMAPIALYPDPLLVAVLQASVVPVDVIAAAHSLTPTRTTSRSNPTPTGTRR